MVKIASLATIIVFLGCCEHAQAANVDPTFEDNVSQTVGGIGMGGGSLGPMSLFEMKGDNVKNGDTTVLAVIGYTRVENACVRGHNIKSFSSKTVPECAKICDAIPSCVAFEFTHGFEDPYDMDSWRFKGHCQPQDSMSTTGCDGKQDGLDLYIREAFCDTDQRATIGQKYPGGGNVVYCPNGQSTYGDGSTCAGGSEPTCKLYGNPSKPLCSSVTTEGVSRCSQVCWPSYWRLHMRRGSGFSHLNIRTPNAGYDGTISDGSVVEMSHERLGFLVLNDGRGRDKSRRVCNSFCRRLATWTLVGCKDVCICANGTAATGSACTANKAEICTSCDRGFHKVGNTCKANTCNCKNGLPATGAECFRDKMEYCVSCNRGFHGSTCEANCCNCANGVAATGAACYQQYNYYFDPEHHRTGQAGPDKFCEFNNCNYDMCESCNSGFHKKANRLIPGIANQGDECQASELTNLGASGCNSSKRCGECQGDCDSDSDCAAGLKCFQRNPGDSIDNIAVPGCAMWGFGFYDGYDYCYKAIYFMRKQYKTGRCVKTLASRCGGAPVGTKGKLVQKGAGWMRAYQAERYKVRFPTGKTAWYRDSELTLCEDETCTAPAVNNQGSGGACQEGHWIDTKFKCTTQCASGYRPSTQALSCDMGVLSPATFTCEANSCTCKDGIAATGAACTSNNAEICASCNSGFHKKGNQCQAPAVTTPGCWVRFPTGCPNKASWAAGKDLRQWQPDDYRGSGSNARRCAQREHEYKSWCGVSRVEVQFVQAATFNLANSMPNQNKFGKFAMLGSSNSIAKLGLFGCIVVLALALLKRRISSHSEVEAPLLNS